MIEQVLSHTLSLVVGGICTHFRDKYTIKSKFDLREASLQAEIAVLQKANLSLQEKTAELQSYIEAHISHQAILAKYTVEESTADLVKDGLHFCSPCFHAGGNSPPEIQMKKLSNGQYQCPVCGRPRKKDGFVSQGWKPPGSH